MRHAGFEPSRTAYRLIEIPLSSITDATSMPWSRLGIKLPNAINGGLALPPVVVMRNTNGSWGLLDGVNRTNAYAVLGRERIRAYEVVRD